MGFVIGTILVVWSFSIFRASGRFMRARRKYEFENTTDGGVVQFKSFEDSEKYKNDLQTNTSKVALAAWGLLIGIIIITFSFASMK